MALPHQKECRCELMDPYFQDKLVKMLLKKSDPRMVFQSFGGPDYPVLTRLQKMRQFFYRLFCKGDPYRSVPSLPENKGNTIKFRRLKPFGFGHVYPCNPEERPGGGTPNPAC